MSQKRGFPLAVAVISAGYVLAAASCGNDFTTFTGSSSSGGAGTGGMTGTGTGTDSAGGSGATNTGGGGTSNTGGGGASQGGHAGQGGQGGQTCEPGTHVSCYTGPAGTLNVGVCEAGEKTCQGDGSGYGPCVGETTPTTEQCGTSDDEDCDTYSACLNPIWATTIGSPSDERAWGFSYDSAGNMYVLGTFQSTVDLDNGVSITNEHGSRDLFLAKLDATGVAQWAEVLGSSQLDDAGDLLVTSSGDIYVAGLARGDTVYAGTHTGTAGLFIAKYDATGAAEWVQNLSTNTSDYADRVTQLVEGPLGEIVAVGWVSADGLLGQLAGWVGGNTDAFVATIDASDGTAIHGKIFGGSGGDGAFGVAVAQSGALLIAGGFEGTLSIANTAPVFGGRDIFVMEYDPGVMPSVQWCKTAGEPGQSSTQEAAAVAVDPSNGNVLVSGYFQGATYFSGDVLQGGDKANLFLARYTSTGGYVKTASFGASGSEQRGRYIAIDGDQIVVAGETTGAVSQGTINLTYADAEDVMVLQFDQDLNPVAGLAFGTADTEVASRLVMDGQGQPVLAAQIYNQLTFAVPVGLVGEQNHQEEILVLKFTP